MTTLQFLAPCCFTGKIGGAVGSDLVSMALKDTGTVLLGGEEEGAHARLLFLWLLCRLVAYSETRANSTPATSMMGAKEVMVSIRITAAGR